MKGKLYKSDKGWMVSFREIKELPLHPDDIQQINEDAKIFDNIEARIAAYPNVDFEILTNYAKLIPDTNFIYQQIEHAIIKWDVDGTKTAGELTREIMNILNN